MQPGVTYTAPDGSTVMMQIIIEQPDLDQMRLDHTGLSPVRFFQPDRPREVRFLEEAPDGRRFTTYVKSRGGVGDSLYTVRGDEWWPDNPSGMINQHGTPIR